MIVFSKTSPACSAAVKGPMHTSACFVWQIDSISDILNIWEHLISAGEVTHRPLLQEFKKVTLYSILRLMWQSLHVHSIVLN